MIKSTVKIAPSILSADFASLGAAVATSESNGADSIHVDIMDGRFVPSLTWGPRTVEALKKWTTLPLDVHMMVSEPERQINDYINAGADFLTVHSEATVHIHHIIESIKSRGIKAGVALNPGTPVSAIKQVLQLLDQILVMTVNPGLPGQKYIAGSERKISEVRYALDLIQSPANLEVDGGINAQTARLAAESGATTLVAGSAIFDHPQGIAVAIETIRQGLK